MDDCPLGLPYPQARIDGASTLAADTPLGLHHASWISTPLGPLFGDPNLPPFAPSNEEMMTYHFPSDARTSYTLPPTSSGHQILGSDGFHALVLPIHANTLDSATLLDPMVVHNSPGPLQQPECQILIPDPQNSLISTLLLQLQQQQQQISQQQTQIQLLQHHQQELSDNQVLWSQTTRHEQQIADLLMTPVPAPRPLPGVSRSSKLDIWKLYSPARYIGLLS